MAARKGNTIEGVSDTTEDSWVQRAEATLTGAGHKRGGARRALLELLAEQRCALTAVEIEEALRGERRRVVSRASVYRILEELRAPAPRAARGDGAGDGALRAGVRGLRGAPSPSRLRQLRRGDALQRSRARAGDRQGQRASAPGGGVRARDRAARRVPEMRRVPRWCQSPVPAVLPRDSQARRSGRRPRRPAAPGRSPR